MGLEKSSGLENVLFWHFQDAFCVHQRILKRCVFVDCGACRGSWGLFEGLIVESGRAADGENKGLLVESVFWDFQVQKCDFQKMRFFSVGERFWWFLVNFSGCRWYYGLRLG